MSRIFQRVKSIKTVLYVLTLLCWLLPTVLLGTFMGTRFFAALSDKTEALLISGAQYAQTQLVNNIDSFVAMARNVTYDGDITRAVHDLDMDNIRYQDYLKIVRNYLERKFSRDRLCEFAVFFTLDDPEDLIYNSQGYSLAEDLRQNGLTSLIKASEELDTHPYFFTYGDTTCLIRNMYDTKLDRYGILVLGVNTDALLVPVVQSAAQLGADWAVQLDTFAAGPMKDAPVDALYEDYGTLYYTQALEGYDYALRFQISADKSEVYTEMLSFRRLMLLLILLLIPLCGLIVIFVQKRIIKPIGILSETSSRIQEGELGLVVPMHGEDELGRLGAAFSAMSLQMRDLIDKSYKVEIALRDARIQAMQSRINPHFLNNALEIILWQARMDKNATIAQMVEALSILLNASLDRRGSHLAFVREEIKVANAYFLFVKLRFGDRLIVQQEVAPDTLDLSVPCMAVQTLIENAVKHGITPAGGGRIKVSIALEKGLCLRVYNNGKVLDDAALEKMRALIKPNSDGNGHVGLHNIAQRLHLLYGDRAEMAVVRTSEGETCVSICVFDAQSQPKTTNHNL